MASFFESARLKIRKSFVALFLLSFSANALDTAAEPMLGPATRAELEARGYAWLKNGVAMERSRLQHDPSAPERLERFAKKVGCADIEIYLGTWCSDTQKYLPIFLASLDFSDARPKSVKFFALDRKRSFPGYVNFRGIERVPTIVFLNKGKEIGRFIETPKSTVVEDILGILP